MELTKKQRILYDFFVKYGKEVGTINYPLMLLNHWINCETHKNLYPEQKAVLEAYLSMENLDKPLYMAIRAIEEVGVMSKNIETENYFFEIKHMSEILEQIYDVRVENNKAMLPKQKFPKAVYDRIKMFGGEEAADAGWTIFGSLKLILGDCERKDYEMNPIGDESKFEPSKEFKNWMDKHYHYGPVLIMLALVYGNYELGDN